MKKVLTILLAIFLVTLSGPIAFANGKIGIKTNYGRKTVEQSFYYDYVNSTAKENIIENSFNIGLFGEYNFSNRLILSGEFDASLSSGKNIITLIDGENNIHDIDTSSYKYTQLDFKFFTKYNVLKFGIANIGLQAGILDSFTKWEDSTNNIFMIALGTYADFEVTNKFNLYTDLKFPIAFFVKNSDENDFNDGFFKLFMYDISLGFSYDIAKNIDLGLNFNVSSANYYGISNGFLETEGCDTKLFSFTIGAKLGYKF